jgi:hypothetical protein
MLTISFLAKQIVIYFGIPCFLSGILGGLFNILVFFSLHTFRQNSCAFYLTMMSSFNMIQMLTGLLPRIMITGFNIDWTQTSIVYCKLKCFSLQFTAYMSSTCLCLATIDQYLITCNRSRWQRWCHIKLAYRLVGIFIIFWSLEQIPVLIYYNHSRSSMIMMNVTCKITNDFFEKFNLYFNRAFIWYILPILITFLFGILAYCNIQQLVYRTIPLLRRELDKQLTMMVFIQVILNFIVIIPSLIIGILIRRANPNNDSIIALEMEAANAINSCIFYLYFAVSENSLDDEIY